MNDINMMRNREADEPFCFELAFRRILDTLIHINNKNSKQINLHKK